MRSILGRPVAAVLFVIALGISPAVGGPVTVQVTGRVTGSDFATIGVDTPVTGYYHYDDATTDSHPHAENGVYEDVTASLSFVDGSTISSDEAWIWVNNNSTGIGTYDEYAVYFPMYAPLQPSPNTLTGSFAGLDVLFGARIYRNDPTGMAWDGVALPDPQSVLALLPNDGSSLSLAATPLLLPPSYNLDFEVTDLSVVPTIPAPGALILVAIGLLCLGWLRRHHMILPHH